MPHDWRRWLGIAGALAFGAATLSGCAQSGPVQIGPDTYMVTNTGTWSWSSGAALKGDLYQQAMTFCQSQGREMLPLNAAWNNATLIDFAHAELQFRCLIAGDPELSRPHIKP